jgi:hypothetical protein
MPTAQSTASYTGGNQEFAAGMSTKRPSSSGSEGTGGNEHHIEQVLGSITTAGYETLYAFVDELLNVCNQQLSSCVSKMLDQHGKE